MDSIKTAIRCMRMRAGIIANCEGCDIHEKCNIEERSEIAKTALSALEKQAPKKIIEKKNGNYTQFHCPNCEQENLNPNAHCKYCPYCGQKWDWSKEND